MEEEEEGGDAESNKTLWKAVFSIIIADVSMSLDNVLAIAAAAKGNLWLIIFGITMSIPIIFMGARGIAKFMNKYKMIIYVDGDLFMYTAVNMITEDRFVIKYINPNISVLLSIISGSLVVLFGLYAIRKSAKKEMRFN